MRPAFLGGIWLTEFRVCIRLRIPCVTEKKKKWRRGSGILSINESETIGIVYLLNYYENPFLEVKFRILSLLY